MRNDESVAKEVALQWLGLVDSEKYEESWRHMAEFARAKIAAGEMAERLSAAREPLGNIVSRDFARSTVLEQVDDAPAGKYVVLEFDSKFSNGLSFTERVTPCMEADGQFKVAGYYLS